MIKRGIQYTVLPEVEGVEAVFLKLKFGLHTTIFAAAIAVLLLANIACSRSTTTSSKAYKTQDSYCWVILTFPISTGNL